MTEAQTRLAEENHNLIYAFLNKYNFSIDEYYDLAAIGYCKAVLDYDIEKGQFSTVAYKYMYNIVTHAIRDKNAEKRVPEHVIVYFQNEKKQDDNNSNFENLIISNIGTTSEALANVIFDEYLKTLRNEDDKILLLAKQGYTQNEISKIIGCSEAKVARAKKLFAEYLKKDELIEK